MNKNRKRKDGFAASKENPSKGHPAYYRYKGKDNHEIEYITFTHSNIVTLKDGDYMLQLTGKNIIVTIPLEYNIDPSNTITKTYVFPYVFEAKREMLGRELTKLKIPKEEKMKILSLFDKLPRIKVNKISNAKKK